MKFSSSIATPIAGTIILFFGTSSALSAAFYDTDCPPGNTTNYYSLDTGGDDGTCYNIGQLYPGMSTPGGASPGAYCSYFENGGGTAMSCPGPLPFNAFSIAVDTAYTPSGTTCNLYYATSCQTDTPSGGSSVPTPDIVYTVPSDGGCANIPGRLPLDNKQTISSFECFPPS